MDFLIIEAVLVVILILLAGALSAADIAIVSFGRSKIEELKEKSHYFRILRELQNTPVGEPMSKMQEIHSEAAIFNESSHDSICGPGFSFVYEIVLQSILR